MAKAEYDIKAGANDGTDGVLWSFGVNTHRIPASLTTAADAWLRFLTFGNSFRHPRLLNRLDRINLNVSAASEAGSSTGPELSDAWEKSAKALTIRVKGVDYVFPGPNAPAGVIARDTTEPYRWEVGSVSDFVTAYRALDATARAGTKLILDDAIDKKQGVRFGGATYKKIQFGGREYSKLYVGGNLIFG